MEMNEIRGKKIKLQIPTSTIYKSLIKPHTNALLIYIYILLNKSFLTWRSFTGRQSLIRSCISWNFLGQFFSPNSTTWFDFYMLTFVLSIFISQKTNVCIININHQLKLLENFIRDRSRNIWSHILFKCSMPV